MPAKLVLGLQHGDEGKGRIVDDIVQEWATVVTRFQGGGNAGHTVYDRKGTFVTELADIKLCGLAGSTDLTSSTERDYVGAGLCVSKSFGSVKPYAGVKLIKPEGADRDTIFGAGVTFNF